MKKEDRQFVSLQVQPLGMTCIDVGLSGTHHAMPSCTLVYIRVQVCINPMAGVDHPIDPKSASPSQQSSGKGVGESVDPSSRRPTTAGRRRDVMNHVWSVKGTNSAGKVKAINHHALTLPGLRTRGI